MERKTPTDAEPVYVRVATEYGLLIMHADTLILSDENEDTLYGEITAERGTTYEEGDMFEVSVNETDNEPDFAPFFVTE